MQNKVTPKKGTPSSSRQRESALEIHKERHAEVEEEERELEDSEEEGDIGESQIMARRAARG